MSTATPLRGSGSNTGGGAGTGSGNGSGSGSGTHPTGGAGTGPKLARAVALIAAGLLLIAAGLIGQADQDAPPARVRPASEQEQRAYEVRRLSEALDELAAQHTQTPAAWSEPAPAWSTSVGAGR